MEYHIDHIDPRWEEGRDYQLVCGLDVPLNLEERDASLNKSKNNRFLPYRVIREEVGNVPVDPGDWVLFLDPDTGEWVLEEFLGEWWYSKTKGFLGQAQPAAREKISQARSGTKLSEEHKKSIGDTMRGKSKPLTEEGYQSVAKSNRERVWTPEMRAKSSESHRDCSDETRAKLRQAQLGKKASPETRAKMRASKRRNDEKKRLAQMSINDPLMPNFED